jgi:hypothetical protein
MSSFTFDDGERRSRAFHPSSDESSCLLRAAKDAIWAPIPWMLEAMFVVLLALNDVAGMLTVGALLGLNLACGLACDKPVRAESHVRGLARRRA